MIDKENIEFTRECVREVFEFLFGLAKLNEGKIETMFGEGLAGFDRFLNIVMISALNIKIDVTTYMLNEDSVSDYVEDLKNALYFLKRQDIKNVKN
jgi:hypothetical protein